MTRGLVRSFESLTLLYPLDPEPKMNTDFAMNVVIALRSEAVLHGDDLLAESCTRFLDAAPNDEDQEIIIDALNDAIAMRDTPAEQQEALWPAILQSSLH